MASSTVDRLFQFSAETADQIRTILEGDPVSLTPVLQALVANYRCRQAECERDSRRSERELQRLAAALRSLLRCINRASPPLRQWLRAQSLGDMMTGTSRWQNLTDLGTQAAENLRRLDTRRGAPLKIDRERLCLEVTLVLHLGGGLTVPASRTGKFATILKIVLHAVGDQPTHMFPLIQRCAQFVRQRTPEELLEVFERTVRLNISPETAVWAESTARRPRLKS